MTMAIKLEDEWVTTEDIAEKRLDELRELRSDIIVMMERDEDMDPRGVAVLLSRVNAEIAMREDNA